jgi:hypothetical protein
MDRKARSGIRGYLPRGRRHCRIYRVLPTRLESKPGRPKSAASFGDPCVTRLNQHPKTLRVWETPQCRRQRLAYPALWP